MQDRRFSVIVIGGGHAGVEAAWAAANILREPRSVALVTLDPSKIGVMSCNPAIGGLAKGQIVREIDALGGLMGLATDAAGIQFKVLNSSKGAAVRGPRAQCDKHAYADEVQRFIATRPEIVVIPGSVERLLVQHGKITGVIVAAQNSGHQTGLSECPLSTVHCPLTAPSVVLTTGTFMRGLMHTGESKTPGGRFGEAAAHGISGALRDLGFELGRLKTGTPPRLSRKTIDWDALEPQRGDAQPTPFSDLSALDASMPYCLDAFPIRQPFPALPQIDCRITQTTPEIHAAIRANLHRAPMYSGQIESAGPRYCPSIEDKVVRFAERETHHVYLEPESLRTGSPGPANHADWIYCNGISTSLPGDVQEQIIRGMPGCRRAEILRLGYAVEYDMVRPHQIAATGMTKLIAGLFLAGQINGTSGYEEAAGQGLIAGINAARFAQSDGDPHSLITIGRDQGYIGVLMDDLVTKTPVEPYRMFTSRAEHRLTLRADNSADRLTPLAKQWGMLDSTDLGRARSALFDERSAQLRQLDTLIAAATLEGRPLADHIRRSEFTPDDLARAIGPRPVADRDESKDSSAWLPGVIFTAHTDRFYAPYAEKHKNERRRLVEMELKRIPAALDYDALPSFRTEARHALKKFRPETLGQAGRLEGITPADLTLLSVLISR